MDRNGIIERLVPGVARFNPACLGFPESEARSRGFWTDERPMPTMEEAEETQLILDAESGATQYQGDRANEYPSPLILNDALVKQHSSDEAIKTEGIAQEEKYYQDCLDVKEANPKPE